MIGCSNCSVPAEQTYILFITGSGACLKKDRFWSFFLEENRNKKL